MKVNNPNIASQPVFVAIKFPFPVKQVSDTEVEIEAQIVQHSMPFINPEMLADAAPELKPHQVDTLIDEINDMVQLERIKASLKLVIRR